MTSSVLQEPGLLDGALAAPALDQLFRDAHTCYKFQDRPVDDATLAQLYDLYKWGPTAMNAQPARVLFVRSAAAKEQLKPALSPGNVEKTMRAPVTAIVAFDTRFFDQLPAQFPIFPGARDLFASNAEVADQTGRLNATLQAAYLMLAARSLGLSVGPMGGFKPDVVNEAFFPDGAWKAILLVNIGWADPDGFFPRGPRLPFDTAVAVR